MRKISKQVLVGARDLVSRPNGWVQGRDHQRVYDPNTEVWITAFCATGAVYEAAGRSVKLAKQILDIELVPLLPLDAHNSVSYFNDARTRTQVEVVALFDHAIGDKK